MIAKCLTCLFQALSAIHGSQYCFLGDLYLLCDCKNLL